MLEMIFTALLLLQLALHYNVEGKHFLVKTKDETSLETRPGNETSLEEDSPVRCQVTAFTHLSDQICCITYMYKKRNQY